MADDASTATSARRWLDELTGGVTGSLVAFSIAVPVGTLTFAPLGREYAGLGVAAGLTGAAIGGLVASVVGSSRGLRSGPMTAVCLPVNTLLVFLLTVPGMQESTNAGFPRMLAFAFLCVIVAGLFEIAFGFLKLGHAIKFVPRPVLAGFRYGLAILIAAAQIPSLLGLAHPLRAYDYATLVNALLPWSLVVGAITIACIQIVRHTRLRPVSLFTGLCVGTVAYHGLAAVLGDARVGPTVGRLPSLLDLPVAWRAMTSLAGHDVSPEAALWVIAPAVSVALIASLLSLLAARLVEDLSGQRANGNRELIAQGLGNVLSGLMGGIPISGSPATSIATYRAGARTRWSTLATSLLLVAGVAFGAPWIEMIPMAALAAVIIVIAIDMLDPDALHLFADLRSRGGEANDNVVDLVIIGAVTITSLAFNIVAGVVLGFFISAAVFALKSSRKVVRRHANGRDRHSLRQRSIEEMRVLRELGAQIVLLELEGPIFFGTADRLSQEVAQHASEALFVILDFARVNAVDATGAHVVGQVARRLGAGGSQLVIASLAPEDSRRRSLERGCPDALAHWLPDADRALEWCEERVLDGVERPSAADKELPLDRIDICRHLDAAEIGRLREVLQRETYTRGTVLFREGEAGECMYLLAQGSVSITLRDPEIAWASLRIVTFAAGVTFGELAVLEGRPRSADATFDSDAVVYSLSSAALEALSASQPSIVIKLHRALAVGLAERLRSTDQELRLLAAQ